MERHGPCCPALSWTDSRRVAGFTCGAFPRITLSQCFDGSCHFIIEREQIFIFWFSFVPSRTRVHMLLQPFDGARSVFGVDGPAVSQFAVQHYPGLVSGLTDKKPVARLVDFTLVAVIQIRITHEQSDSRHFTFEQF